MDMRPISVSKLRHGDPPESSAATRICETLAMNVQNRHRDLLQFCKLNSHCANVFSAAIDALDLSTLAHDLLKSNISPPVPEWQIRALPKIR
jgi:hypothetical protein